jgi:hypothetical protein
MDDLIPPSSAAPGAGDAPVVETPATVAEPPKSPAAPDPAAEAEAAADAAAKAEDDEWAAAAAELSPKKEPAKDESAEPKKGAKKEAEDKKDPVKKDGDEKPGDGDEAKDKSAKDAAKDEQPDTTARDTRLAQREAAQEVKQVKVDVREKMFKDAPTELKDADGDPIKSSADVMKLMNTVTGKPFTEAEATAWLNQAQQQLIKNVATMESQIEAITEVNITLKDEADVVKGDYGELLKVMPDLRDKLWAEYSKTLSKDDKTGIITKAPVSLESFYRMALEPYAKMAAQLEGQETAKAEAAAKAEADAAKAKADRKQAQLDRSDIYGGGKIDESTDPDAKEWAEAAEATFGPRKR